MAFCLCRRTPGLRAPRLEVSRIVDITRGPWSAQLRISGHSQGFPANYRRAAS
eukprot:CAMPEP_0170439838 /NCGR_PEP_ID=MMETSP0117_2-20130122/46002_1 /TAXON_ID=400756 /ORGANISM="Durinskia baltica, Strain CSIRO CS-38" /LENGTH=52 /DNA_ID=CAMNT_0010700195 /DNA_START=162 /DNA_END=317 /DNA_ORIENTATION=-